VVLFRGDDPEKQIKETRNPAAIKLLLQLDLIYKKQRKQIKKEQK
jgi:hypothetical protein